MEHNGKPLVSLVGGENLIYSNGGGWLNSDGSHTSITNIVKLNVKEGIKTSLYDPQSGTITADQDGPYKLAYRVRLYSDPAEEAFDGTAGGFGTWITINNEQASLPQVQHVFRGVKIPYGWVFYDSNDDQILYKKRR